MSANREHNRNRGPITVISPPDQLARQGIFI
jgi:hypothetical protein